jgi:nitroreductase
MLVRLLKRVLPLAAISWLKQTLARMQRLFIRLFAANGFLASLYYTFFSRKFDREHKAVLQGRLMYAAEVASPGKSSALLRRNIHRLEKGLIMLPRKPVFAQAYITETVAIYARAVNKGQLCQQELSWATDVLQQYFAVVEDNAIIAAARATFGRLSQGSEMPVGTAVPYAHHTLPDNPVSYDQLLTLFQRRRSVRWYQQKGVDPAILRQAVAAAALAPTACNRQPYQFYIINNAVKAADIASCAMGTTGFADNIPCLIVVVGDLSAYEAERDRHVIYIDAALASMQLILALESLGLQSCPINWPDSEPREREIAQKLELQYWQRPVMLLATGYALPDGGVPFSQKKPAELLIKEIY